MIEDNNFPTLPSNWLWVEIGEICEGVVPGRTKPKSFYGTIPWITLPDVTELYVSNSQSNLAVTREDAETVGMKVMPKGSVLMSCVGQFGLVCIAENDLVPNQQFHGFICLDRVLPEYVAYALMTQVAQMNQLASATTIAYINKTKCNSIQIPLSPFNEQRRIVAKIKALKARNQKAKEALEAIPALLDQFRQSVLAAAFRGDLTADWREKNPDVEPASVLLERIRAERRHRWEEAELERMKVNGKILTDDKWKSNYKEALNPEQSNLPDLPSGWMWVTMDALIVEGPQNGIYLPQAAYGSGTPILRIDDFQDGWSCSSAELRLVNASDKEVETYSLCKGDIVINRVNSPSHLGKSLLVEARNIPAIFESNMMRLRLADLVSAIFIERYLRSSIGKQYLTKNAKWAVNQASINQTDVRKTLVPLPPITEQNIIVKVVKQQLSFLKKVNDSIQAGEQFIDVFNQSILAKAFRGELVPQDPNDEPASVLLERIQAERVKREAEAKTAKKSTGKTTGQRSRKAKQQDSESTQLGLPGLE